MTAVSVIARLERIRRIIHCELEATFAEHGLNESDFAALATLRRLDQPGGVSQRQLMHELNLTSGTVSVRVDRLGARGLVTRTPDAYDRRNSLVSLTGAGQALFDRTAPAHLATEKRLLSALSSDQIDALIPVLRQLLVSFEGSVRDKGLPRLGLALAPAHVTVEMRRAVGLPEVVGLLVREVAPGSRAAQAGIAVGDVLVRAGNRELRSVTSLYAAVSDAWSSKQMVISAVRGLNTNFSTTVDLDADPPEDIPLTAEVTVSDSATHAV